MIRYRHLTIENYKSIAYAEIDFTPGVYQVVGRTLNGDYTSNGSGKSSALQALVLVLYNKDFQGAPIETLSNRFTGKPFRLSLIMDVERDGIEATYEIVNDRASKKLSVTRNGVQVSNNTNKSLKLIQDILGMSEGTFKFTHYITTSSILDLTKNISNATLFNEVLQVVQLKAMGQDFLEIKKDITRELEVLDEEFRDLISVKKMLDISDKYNIPDIEDEMEAIQIELDRYEQLRDSKVTPLMVQLGEDRSTEDQMKLELRQKQQSNSTGICETCGTQLADDDTLVKLQGDIETLHRKLDAINITITNKNDKLVAIKEAFRKETTSLYTRLEELDKDLILGQQLLEVHSGMLEGSTTFSEDRLKEVTKQRRELRLTIDNLEKSRDAIRSGKIFEDIMNDFFILVNSNIQKYRKVINLTAFDVEASSYKAGMVVILKHNGDEIPVESLSNGEKARLSLLILVALLEAMQQTAQSDSNFISFDEPTSSFDVSGIAELRNLFEHMKELEQSCFIITHGSELQAVSYDGTLTMVKEANITTAEFIKE